MTGLSFLVFITTPIFVVFLPAAPVPTNFVVRSPAGLPSIVAPVSVGLSAGRSPGSFAALAVRTSAHLFSTPPNSQFRAVVVLAGSLPGSASAAGASYSTNHARQLTLADSQRDAAREELAAVMSEFNQVRHNNDKFRLALNPLHDTFNELRSSLLELVSQVDVIKLRFHLFDDMHDDSS